jgi:hypothetical protein
MGLPYRLKFWTICRLSNNPKEQAKRELVSRFIPIFEGSLKKYNCKLPKCHGTSLDDRMNYVRELRALSGRLGNYLDKRAEAE